MEKKAKLEGVVYEKGQSQLHKAARKGSLKLIRSLLNHGADLNAVDIEGCTALHVAIDRFHPKAASMLIEGGAKEDLKDNKGQTPLQEAGGKGSLWIIGSLLKHGADLNAVDIPRYTRQQRKVMDKYRLKKRRRPQRC